MADESDDDFDFEEMRQKWKAARKKEFDFDEWAKEIDTHPAFMKSMPVDGELSEAAAAIQALKYDDEDSPEVQAKAYKDDGNKNFELKKYHWAIDNYTAGIKLRCKDLKLNAVLYANRAACHFRLGNYRSALKDCVLANRFDHDHAKAAIRAAECLLKLNAPSEALQWINGIESIVQKEDPPKMTYLDQLKADAMKVAKVKARDERKAKQINEKDRIEKLELVEALKARHIRFRERIPLDDPDQLEWCQLEVSLPGEERVARVHFDEKMPNTLVWPVLFIYPEVSQTDLIREFQETEVFRTHIEVMFSAAATWDNEHTYDANTIEIYFKSEKDPEKLVKLPSLDTTLAQAMAHPEYCVVGGFPNFILYSRTSSRSQDRLSKVSISSF